MLETLIKFIIVAVGIFFPGTFFANDLHRYLLEKRKEKGGWVTLFYAIVWLIILIKVVVVSYKMGV